MQTDCITVQHIEPHRLVSVQSGSTTHHFDVETLYRFWYESGEEAPLNPFTRTHLNGRASRFVSLYAAKTLVLVSVSTHTLNKQDVYSGLYTTRLPSFVSVGDAIMHVYDEMNDAGIDLLDYDIVVSNDGRRMCSLVDVYETGTSISTLDLNSPICDGIDFELIEYPSLVDKTESMRRLYEHTLESDLSGLMVVNLEMLVTSTVELDYSDPLVIRQLALEECIQDDGSVAECVFDGSVWTCGTYSYSDGDWIYEGD